MILSAVIFNTFFTALLGLTIAGILGYFIGRRLGGGSNNLQLAYDEKCQALDESEKSFKHFKKNAHRLEEESKNWKDKFHVADKEAKGYQQEYDTVKSEFDKSSSALKSSNDRLNQFENKNQRLEKEILELKQKISKEKKDTKAWRKEIEQAQKETTNFKSRFENEKQAHQTVKSELDGIQEKLAEYKKMKTDNRILRTKVKQLGTDCEYWEKMHYNTHHELAALKEQHEKMQSEVSELEMQKNGVQLEKEQTMKMVAEYKSKFVNVNNQYRELLSKVGKN